MQWLNIQIVILRLKIAALNCILNSNLLSLHMTHILTHLRNDTDAPRDGCCFGLGSTHAPEPRADKHPAAQVTRTNVPSAGIQNRQLG